MYASLKENVLHCRLIKNQVWGGKGSSPNHESLMLRATDCLTLEFFHTQTYTLLFDIIEQFNLNKDSDKNSKYVPQWCIINVIFHFLDHQTFFRTRYFVKFEQILKLCALWVHNQNVFTFVWICTKNYEIRDFLIF